MVKFWCKVCGGITCIQEGTLVETCAVCGARQALPHSVDEEYMQHVSELNRMRQQEDYEASSALADALIERDSTDAALYWQRLLIQYEAVYRQEEGQYGYVLDCRKANPQPVMEHEDYQRVWRYASVAQRAIYEEDAKLLERARREVCGEAYVPDESVSPLNSGFLCLEDGEWKAAMERFDRVLLDEPENALAYFGKMMAELHVKRESELIHVGTQIPETQNHAYVMQYGDEALQSRVNQYWEKAALTRVWENCEQAKTVDDWKRIKKMLQQLPDSEKVQQHIFLCDKEIHTIMMQQAEVVFGCRDAARMGITTETLGVRVVNAKYYYDTEITEASYDDLRSRIKTDRSFTVVLGLCSIFFLLSVIFAGLFFFWKSPAEIKQPSEETTAESIAELPTESQDESSDAEEITEPEDELCVVGNQLFVLRNGKVMRKTDDESSNYNEQTVSGSSFPGNFSPYASSFETWSEITALYSDPTGAMLFGVCKNGTVVYDIFSSSNMHYEKLYHEVVSWRDVKMLTIDQPDDEHAYLFAVTKSGGILVSDSQMQSVVEAALSGLSGEKIVDARAAQGCIYMLLETGEYISVAYQ